MKLTKILSLFMLAGIFGLASPQTAKAQAGGDNGGNVGLGVMLGEPTGISLKAWNNSRSAFDFGVAWSFAGSDDDIYLHADYLLHSWIDGVEQGQLAFYYGIGGRMVFSDDPTAGIRIPFGLNYLIGEAPVGVFMEVVPVLNLTPDTDFDGNGALGIRYYF